MNHYYFFLLLYFIEILKAELSLQIVKNINYNQVPVHDILHEIAGTNLTLICKLLTTNDETDYELSWGRKRRNIQFNTITDLQNLSKNNPNPLLQFRSLSNRNKAALSFQPLFVLDSGKYFCMSLKYNLFNIIQINVNVGSEPSDLVRYFEAMDNSNLDINFANLNKPLAFPKFMCTEDMFVCNSGMHCFNDEYVCDGVKDCNDGSDENLYLCGKDPCEGKRLCTNGRCISKSLCCDKFQDPYCMVNVKHACCLEKKEKHFSDEEITPLQHDIYNPSNDLNVNEIEGKTIWTTHEQPQGIKGLWIVVPCILILILVIMCIVVRQFFMKPVTRTRFIRNQRRAFRIPNNREISLVTGTTSSDQGSTLSRSVSPNINPNDLPPSYEEVMGNNLQAVLPYYKNLRRT